jgi:hypothetical protein
VEEILMPKINTEEEIDHLLCELSGFSAADREDIKRFLYHGEYECAMHLLVGTARKFAHPVSESEFAEIERLAKKVDMANQEWLAELNVVRS